MYQANCSLFWHEKQHISVDVFMDYATTGSAFTCEFSGGLSSTLHDINSLSVSIKHHHNATKVESAVRVTVRKLLRSKTNICILLQKKKTRFKVVK